MEYKNMENSNLIKFLPIEQGDKVLVLHSMAMLPEEKDSYDWIFVLPYEEKEQDAPKLQKLLGMVKKQGHLYLAVENPFSLHRISGEAEEDGSFFKAFLPGGFEESRGMSLAFLMEQARCALKNCQEEYSLKVYYPYPDIRFPLAVYTDEYLPKPGECDENFYNFSHPRFCFFDERTAADEVVKAGVYSQFAGGYLLEIAKENTDMLYCRYSVERDEGKKIRTTILKDKNGEMSVQKSAFEEASNEHIRKLSSWEEKLTAQLQQVSFLDRPLAVNKIIDSKKQNGKEQVSFSFVKGESLEAYLDAYLKNGQFESCKETLLGFCIMIKQLKDQKPFQVTEEFIKVFGKIEFGQAQEKDMTALSVTDIDMVCQNILLGEQITLIDYEWTFDFPIPVDYLIYRVLFCYLEQKNRRKSKGFDNSFDFYEEMGISKERKKLFEQMEIHFQKYAQGNCRLLRDSYLEKGKPVVPMSLLKEQLHKAEENTILIQYDMGAGFMEENSFQRVLGQEENGTLSLVLDLPEDGCVQAVQMGFGEENTMIRIGLLQEDAAGSKEISYETNGILVNPILYLYQEKPYLCIRHLNPEVKRLYISLQIEKLPEAFIGETIRSLSDMREVIANREQQISNYENSTSWKITKPLREFGRKK